MRRQQSDADRQAKRQADHVAGDIKAARAEHAMTRKRVSQHAGVSSDTARRVEAGDPSVQLDTLCAVGAAVGLDIVVRAYRSRPPSLRDSGQLRVAQIVCSLAHHGWDPVLEMGAGDHGEAVDIGFLGAREILATEIDRLILDFQDQYRRNALKRDYLALRHQRPVRLVMVVEDTARNHTAIAPHLAFIRSVLPARSREILKALRTGEPLGRDGLLWIRRNRVPPPPRR